MTPEQTQLIAVDAKVVHGQAHVRGTRIPVSVILHCLAAGMSEGDSLEQYPSLSITGMRAQMACAAELTREEILPLPAPGR